MVSASAAPVTVLATNADAWSQVLTSQCTALPTGGRWETEPGILPEDLPETAKIESAEVPVLKHDVIQSCSWACSPFDPFAFAREIAGQNFVFNVVVPFDLKDGRTLDRDDGGTA